MPYVSAKEMLYRAREGGYAVGAFNAENMETVQAIVAAAERMNSPVMVQTTPGSIKHAGIRQFAAMARAAAEAAGVDVCLHLDHGDSVGLCRDCIGAGYSSVMIDGSRLPFEKNVDMSRKVVELAHAHGVTVEAELGALGGKEDGLEGAQQQYTDPADARRFCRETGVDSLAIAVGTAHGVYKTTPVLDLDRIDAIRRVTDVPLVLHGSSGLSDQCVIECVRRGICKVNFATELRIAFTDAVREYMMNHSTVFDPKKYLGPAREAVCVQVMRRIAILRR